MKMKPDLVFSGGYLIPPCELPASHPYRLHNVFVTRVDGGWDIRMSVPLLVQLSDDTLAGVSLSDRAEEIAKNCGVMMTNDLWLELVPLIKEKIAES